VHLTFKEVRSKQKIQFAFMNIGYSVDSGDKRADAYFHSVQTECMQFTVTNEFGDQTTNLLLFSLEKLQKDGFLVRIHDLRHIVTEEFFLISKSNGIYSKQPRSKCKDMVFKEDFRAMVQGLTFQTDSTAFNYSKSPLLLELRKDLALKDRSRQDQTPGMEATELMPHREQATVSKKVDWVKQALSRVDPQREQLNSESLLLQGHPRYSNTMPLDQRGSLLFRDFFIVRCHFEGQEETESESLISLYQNMEVLNVEVFLYKDQEKMSIAS
jgi:hypothetical protein